MQHLFHLFLLLHVLAATGRLAAAPLDALPGPEKPSPLDTFILEGMKEAKVPGLAALVIRDGSVAWSGYYGWANVETRTPVSRDTRFQLASVSKTVTACAIMQQVEQGKLDLDADINSVLPFTVRNPGHPERPITLRHLLTHSSGIKDNWDLLEDTWVKNGDFPKPLGKSLADYLQEAGAYFHARKNFYPWAPGDKSTYSNVAIALAAYVAEAGTKTAFETLCENGIFKPLGMEGSGFRLAAVDREKLAMPYGYRKKSGELKALGHHGYLDFPAGTLRTSGPHLARFLRMFMGDGQVDDTRIMQAATVGAMRRISFPKVATRQGLAWYYDKVGGTRMLGHDGSDPGVTTQMFYRPEDRTGFILLMNAEPRKRAFEQALCQRLLKQAR